MSVVEPSPQRSVFDIPYRQHRELRVRAFLAHFNAASPPTSTPVQLLSQLSSIEDQFSDAEKRALSPWLGGAGLLSDFTPILRKANSLGKRVATTAPVAHQAPSSQRIVQVSEAQECSVCLTELPGVAFPRHAVTPKCRHGSHTCRECLKQCLQVQVGQKPWNRITCPECPAVLNFHRMKEFAPPEAFKIYDQKVTLARLKRDPNFVMCADPSCNSGQIHSGGKKQPIVRCISCSSRTCFTHKITWHIGLTCATYDALHMSQADQEVASIKYLTKHSKICPNRLCGLHVEKTEGCDHMYCTHCHFEFCWLCLAPYDKIRKIGNSAHALRCKYKTT